MKTLSSRLFFLTLAVYVFASCTGDPLVKPIKEGIDAQDYEAAIVAADSALLTSRQRHGPVLPRLCNEHESRGYRRYHGP